MLHAIEFDGGILGMRKHLSKMRILQLQIRDAQFDLIP
jgi:hypothetical protein